jgi:hypothetical protein
MKIFVFKDFKKYDFEPYCSSKSSTRIFQHALKTSTWLFVFNKFTSRRFLKKSKLLSFKINKKKQLPKPFETPKPFFGNGPNAC